MTKKKNKKQYTMEPHIPYHV
ncbi:hypothetical protein WWK_02392, partial [Staphylococcus aureus M1286]